MFFNRMEKTQRQVLARGTQELVTGPCPYLWSAWRMRAATSAGLRTAKRSWTPVLKFRQTFSDCSLPLFVFLSIYLSVSMFVCLSLSLYLFFSLFKRNILRLYIYRSKFCHLCCKSRQNKFRHLRKTTFCWSVKERGIQSLLLNGTKMEISSLKVIIFRQTNY